jgi:hypothetical protein
MNGLRRNGDAMKTPCWLPKKAQKITQKKSGKLVSFINDQPLPLRPQKKRVLW